MPADGGRQYGRQCRQAGRQLLHTSGSVSRRSSCGSRRRTALLLLPTRRRRRGRCGMRRRCSTAAAAAAAAARRGRRRACPRRRPILRPRRGWSSRLKSDTRQQVNEGGVGWCGGGRRQRERARQGSTRIQHEVHRARPRWRGRLLRQAARRRARRILAARLARRCCWFRFGAAAGRCHRRRRPTTAATGRHRAGSAAGAGRQPRCRLRACAV